MCFVSKYDCSILISFMLNATVDHTTIGCQSPRVSQKHFTISDGRPVTLIVRILH